MFLKYKTNGLLFQKKQCKCVNLVWKGVHTVHIFTVSLSVCLRVCASLKPHTRHTQKKRYPERRREKAPLQEERKPKFRQHMFLGRPLLSVLVERRDTLTVSCSSGLSPHLLRWSFLARAAIFISVHGKCYGKSVGVRILTVLLCLYSTFLHSIVTLCLIKSMYKEVEKTV